MDISEIKLFSDVLDSLGLGINKVNPAKSKCISIRAGGSFSPESFSKRIKEKMTVDSLERFPGLLKLLADVDSLTEACTEIARETGSLVTGESPAPIIPDEYKCLTLNLDETHDGKDLRFFMTNPDETPSRISGTVYLKVTKIKEEEAVAIARKVVPEYRPRSPLGVVEEKLPPQETSIRVLNTYIPPMWTKHKGKLPDCLPPDFNLLVKHLVPNKIDREYLFNWIYTSMFKRSYVYLILSGAGGIGKNTFKQFLVALHGQTNSVDGKESTFTKQFNSQMQDATLMWFDELSYDSKMENVMKEVQNDTISIEKKNYDATRRTKIYTSFVISNNKPRDNYIAFDARKFAPLVLTSRRLDKILKTREISQMIARLDESKPTYDAKYVAQIARYIKYHGWTNKWPTLEYKGPMFYKLAHTSMTRWQKKAAALIMEAEESPGARIIYDKERGFLWSTVEQDYIRKGGKQMNFPDYTSVKYFFDVFVDSVGEKSFETSLVKKDIMCDFYVKCLNKKIKIITESELLEDIGGGIDYGDFL